MAKKKLQRNQIKFINKLINLLEDIRLSSNDYQFVELYCSESNVLRNIPLKVMLSNLQTILKQKEYYDTRTTPIILNSILRLKQIYILGSDSMLFLQNLVSSDKTPQGLGAIIYQLKRNALVVLQYNEDGNFSYIKSRF